MGVLRIRGVVIAVLLAVLAVPGSPLALAHGSVTAGDDLCVIRIGFYTAHFKIFQPATSANREFCEDLPATGETIFVMEYLHQALGSVPLEFRIVRNETGLGRFTRLEDLQKIADLDSVTVFHQNPSIATAVYTAGHHFAADGDYLGVVTVRHPHTEETFMAVFPFHVGRTDWGLLPLLLALGVLAQLGFWLATGSLRRWYARVLPGVVVLLLGSVPTADLQAQEVWVSDSGSYRMRYHSEADAGIPLNRMHSWIIHLESATGDAVTAAELQLAGGMPAHNHGLATAPVVSAELGNGDYRVEGLRFHMPGQWELLLTIKRQGRTDLIRFSLVL